MDKNIHADGTSKAPRKPLISYALLGKYGLLHNITVKTLT